MMIKEYRELIEKIDDCTFGQVMEELNALKIDLQTFDRLLKSESRTEYEDIYLQFLVIFTKLIIMRKLEDKLEDTIQLIMENR